MEIAQRWIEHKQHLDGEKKAVYGLIDKELK
jgi:hypothetical protein